MKSISSPSALSRPGRGPADVAPLDEAGTRPDVPAPIGRIRGDGACTHAARCQPPTTLGADEALEGALPGLARDLGVELTD